MEGMKQAGDTSGLPWASINNTATDRNRFIATRVDDAAEAGAGILPGAGGVRQPISEIAGVSGMVSIE